MVGSGGSSKPVWLLVAFAGLLAAAVPAWAATKQPQKPPAKAGKSTAVPAKLGKNVPVPRPRPAHIVVPAVKLAAPAARPAAKPAEPAPGRPLQLTAATPGLYGAAGLLSPASAMPTSAPVGSGMALAYAPTASTSAEDVAAVKQVIHFARRGRSSDADDAQSGISDPLARKLAEWVILRSDDNDATFSRYLAFVNANPTWPSIGLLRRRAEATLWQEKADAATVRAYFAHQRPLTAKGRFALARALLAQGDRTGAQALVREAWREPFSRELEAQAEDAFDSLLTRADAKARMDRRLYAGDSDIALRIAQRLGGAELAIAKARMAVRGKASNAKALLDAVPAEARRDPGYMFSAIQWLRRNDRIEDAARMMLAVPRELGSAHDLDEWWIERRLVARKLLDIGDAGSAYLVARDAVPPTKENYRVEHQFTAGWIALRFLHDPATASQHFARILATGVANPISLARAGYWQGRAAEAAGRTHDARRFYEQAARYNTAYYGQLARARLGLAEVALTPPPVPLAEKRAALARLEVVRAAEILYALDERNLVIPFVVDLADRTLDAGALVVLAELAARHHDARSVLLIGKSALARGLAFDHYAFPTIGLPRYSNIGPEVEPAVVYSIARQESEFNPMTVSSANALGLMQVTPEAGRYIAKKFHVAFDQKRLLHDTVYNVQMGAAELGDDIEAYRGSYILAFAGYNAGRGRVKEWIERYGDPREPGVDPVDWVERIPFSETRNYVQRILENLQVYRIRFGGNKRLLIEADLRRGASAN
jgi:soluble lytic murein transglycosylase